MIKNYNPGRGFLKRGGLTAAVKEVLKRPRISQNNIGYVWIFSPLTCPGTRKFVEQLAQGFRRAFEPRENGETILIFQNY